MRSFPIPTQSGEYPEHENLWAGGVSLDYTSNGCSFSGNWLWLDSSTPYTAELAIEDGSAVLTVEGVGQSTGTVNYEGAYTTLWVGNNGRGDWPECTGTIDSVIVEPLN